MSLFAYLFFDFLYFLVFFFRMLDFFFGTSSFFGCCYTQGLDQLEAISAFETNLEIKLNYTLDLHPQVNEFEIHGNLYFYKAPLSKIL